MVPWWRSPSVLSRTTVTGRYSVTAASVADRTDTCHCRAGRPVGPDAAASGPKQGSTSVAAGNSVSGTTPSTSGLRPSAPPSPSSPVRIASASRSSYAGCTATHSVWSTARDTSRGANPGADGCAASTTSSYGWAWAGSSPAACSTCWYSSSRIGSVGSVPTALTTAVTVRGRTVRSALDPERQRTRPQRGTGRHLQRR